MLIFMYVSYKQKVAPERPKVMKTMKPSSESENDTVKAKTGGIAWGHQMWHTNGTRCPRGTVPIRRTTVSDILRAKSLFDYGKKSQRRTNAPDVASGNGHEVCDYVSSPFYAPCYVCMCLYHLHHHHLFPSTSSSPN